MIPAPQNLVLNLADSKQTRISLWYRYDGARGRVTLLAKVLPAPPGTADQAGLFEAAGTGAHTNG